MPLIGFFFFLLTLLGEVKTEITIMHTAYGRQFTFPFKKDLLLKQLEFLMKHFVSFLLKCQDSINNLRFGGVC